MTLLVRNCWVGLIKERMFGISTADEAMLSVYAPITNSYTHVAQFCLQSMLSTKRVQVLEDDY